MFVIIITLIAFWSSLAPIQGTFGEHSWNIQGKFREHSVNVKSRLFAAKVVREPSKPSFQSHGSLLTHSALLGALV
jgi:hypothetical protein